MPVVSRINVADYQLLTSRHFFAATSVRNAKYILTKSTQFNQSMDTSVQPLLRLTSQVGVNAATTGIETVSYGQTLSLPVLVGQDTRPPYTALSRAWVDGLDFIDLILGNYCLNLDTYTNNLLRNNGSDYDAVVVKKIGIEVAGENEIIVTVEFGANVENVFEFIGRKTYPLQTTDHVLDLMLNFDLPEMRAARAWDVRVGLQNKNKQKKFKLMTSCSLNFEFITDEVPLYGSKRPRKVLVPTNHKVSGNFTVVEHPFSVAEVPGFSRYREDKGFTNYSYALFPPNFQRYNVIALENAIQDSQGVLSDFSIDFSNIYQSQFLMTFSGRQVDTQVNRTVTNGVLTTTVNFFDYNYKERSTT